MNTNFPFSSSLNFGRYTPPPPPSFSYAPPSLQSPWINNTPIAPSSISLAPFEPPKRFESTSFFNSAAVQPIPSALTTLHSREYLPTAQLSMTDRFFSLTPTYSSPISCPTLSSSMEKQIHREIEEMAQRNALRRAPPPRSSLPSFDFTSLFRSPSFQTNFPGYPFVSKQTFLTGNPGIPTRSSLSLETVDGQKISPLPPDRIRDTDRSFTSTLVSQGLRHIRNGLAYIGDRQLGIDSVNASQSSATDRKIIAAFNSFSVHHLFGAVGILTNHLSVARSSPSKFDFYPQFSDIPSVSCTIKYPGIQLPNLQVGGVNGMNVSRSEAMRYPEIVSRFARSANIEWVYDHSNSFPVDFAEIFALNFRGISAPAHLIARNWMRFYVFNFNNPKAYYFHICHSKGAIDTKIALDMMPRQVREKVIVLALAPAEIIPDKLCKAAFNYASTRDVVPYAKIFSSLIAGNILQARAEWQNIRKNLVLLEPHPDADWFDHAFLSPTFTNVIEDLLEEVINGEIE